MEVALTILQELSYAVIHHPVYSAVGCILLLVSMLRFYCRMTLGMCDIEQDMSGKTVLITGASAGIGKATALDMAKRNARVLLACRNMDKANKVAEEIKTATGNQNVVVKCLDLSSFESVRKCAKSVLETEDKLHVLINNAGIIGISPSLTKDNCEITAQSNHFGHFLLTLLLLDLLKRSAPSRIINVSSDSYMYAKFDLKDINVADPKTKPFYYYANSKLCNVLFTTELAERLRGTGVTVNALHPGAVKTEIMQKAEISRMSIMSRIIYSVVGKSPDEGAQTTIRLAVDPQLEKTTGKYFRECKETPVTEIGQDKVTAKRLFELSEKTVGASF